MSEDPGHGEDEHSEEHDGHDHSAMGGTALTPEQDGYAIALTSPSVPKGDDVEIQFTIFGPDGKPVTDFDVKHEQKMHMLVVSNDLVYFFHEHPTMSEDGKWTAKFPMPGDGTYRIVADFVPAGAENIAVGETLTVGSGSEASPALAESRISEIDGYRAELVGDTMHEDSAPLKVVITSGGQPVTDVKPYLGAAAHFVAFSESDLAYFHVHPNGANINSSGEITFTAPPLDHGLYKGFVQVDIGGELRTFEFVWEGK